MPANQEGRQRLILLALNSPWIAFLCVLLWAIRPLLGVEAVVTGVIIATILIFTILTIIVRSVISSSILAIFATIFLLLDLGVKTTRDALISQHPVLDAHWFIRALYIFLAVLSVASAIYILKNKRSDALQHDRSRVADT